MAVQPSPDDEIIALAPATATPDASEWKLIERQANAIANTQLVPQAYRGKPQEIVACALTAREVGIGMMQALRHIYIVDGKPTMSAELMVSLVRKRGHSISGKSSAQSAVVVGRRRDNGDTVEVTWTVDMARRAGLLTKQNWSKYPESMLWARAVSQLCRMLFPDCIGGIGYTLEELESGDNTSGKVIDRRSPTPVAAEDRDDAVASADPDDSEQPPVLEGEIIDPSLARPLTQAERDELKEAAASIEDARVRARAAYKAVGVYDEALGDWRAWDEERDGAKFAWLTVRHRDWIRENF